MKDIPGIQNAVRIVANWDYSIYRVGDKILKSGDNGAVYADSSHFKVFDFKMIKGESNNPFPALRSVILTENTAKRFFGDDDVMGKMIVTETRIIILYRGSWPIRPATPAYNSICCFLSG